jgi:hypothetical protein
LGDAPHSENIAMAVAGRIVDWGEPKAAVERLRSLFQGARIGA